MPVETKELELDCPFWDSSKQAYVERKVRVRVVVDWHAVATSLADRALRNRSGVARKIYGAVRVERLGR